MTAAASSVCLSAANAALKAPPPPCSPVYTNSENALTVTQKNQARGKRTFPVPVAVLTLWLHSCQEKTLVVGGVVALPHVFVIVFAGQRALAQDRTAGRVLSHLDHLCRRLHLGKLLGLGGVFQRRH